MISLNYKIKVDTIHDKPLKNLINEVGPYQSIKNYENVDSIRLEVKDNDLINNAFRLDKSTTGEIVSRDGFIYKQNVLKKKYFSKNEKSP